MTKTIEEMKEAWIDFNVKQCESQGVDVTGDMITAFKLMADYWLALLTQRDRELREKIEKMKWLEIHETSRKTGKRSRRSMTVDAVNGTLDRILALLPLNSDNK